jgi:indole-3-glycerol phosphate synthase
MSLPRFAQEAQRRVGSGYYIPRGETAEAVRRRMPIERSLASAISARRGVVAEIKPASPTSGSLRNVGKDDIGGLARNLEVAGARGLSVLTVREGFGGSMDALREAAASVHGPVLMKDFLVDPAQLTAAARARASVVLLIPEILGRWNLRDAIDSAHEQGLEVLLETYDEAGFRAAKATDADIIAVNNRDLRDPALPIDLARFARVVKAAGKDRPTMSLSGCRTRADVEAQIKAGADAVLVGSHLMAASDPAAALREVLP